MPGRIAAVNSGAQLQQAVVELGRALGLETREQVRVGRRLWGSERNIDVVFTHREGRRSLGVECKYQGVGGRDRKSVV